MEKINFIEKAKNYINYFVGMLLASPLAGSWLLKVSNADLRDFKETLEGLLVEIDVSVNKIKIANELAEIREKDLKSQSVIIKNLTDSNKLMESCVTSLNFRNSELDKQCNELDARMENMVRGNNFVNKEYFNSAVEGRQVQISALTEEIRVLQEAAQMQDDYKERYLTLKDACKNSFANSARIRDLVGG